MNSIKSYTDTVVEINILKERMSLLLDEKMELYNKYFSTSISYDKIAISANKIVDVMGMYIYELTEVIRKSGMSLDEEIKTKKREIDRDILYLDNMTKQLKKLSGIKYKLFYKIINGKTISKAVREISEEEYIHEQTVWNKYYKPIKSQVKRIYNYNDII